VTAETRQLGPRISWTLPPLQLDAGPLGVGQLTPASATRRSRWMLPGSSQRRAPCPLTTTWTHVFRVNLPSETSRNAACGELLAQRSPAQH
jgi:hypothetical protein